MIAITNIMKASRNRERCRKHGSSEDEEKDTEEEEEEEEEEELDGIKSPVRSPLDLGMALSMPGERSSAGKDKRGGEASGEIHAWNSESSSRETFLHLCRVQ